MAMDSELINLVNKLQDTFSNLGKHTGLIQTRRLLTRCAGGELDMPQIAVVSYVLSSGTVCI